VKLKIWVFITLLTKFKKLTQAMKEHEACIANQLSSVFGRGFLKGFSARESVLYLLFSHSFGYILIAVSKNAAPI
jgi:hypothetical protein